MVFLCQAKGAELTECEHNHLSVFSQPSEEIDKKNLFVISVIIIDPYEYYYYYYYYEY